MSIYASLDAPSELEHDPGCDVWEALGDGMQMLTILPRPMRPCSCTRAMVPLVYRGSHILPSEADPRGGCVDLSSIPGHIRREGRGVPSNDRQPYPFLRIGVNEAALVLTRAQVARVHRTLGAWLRATRGSSPVE